MMHKYPHVWPRAVFAYQFLLISWCPALQKYCLGWTVVLCSRLDALCSLVICLSVRAWVRLCSLCSLQLASVLYSLITALVTV